MQYIYYIPVLHSEKNQIISIKFSLSDQSINPTEESSIGMPYVRRSHWLGGTFLFMNRVHTISIKKCPRVT